MAIKLEVTRHVEKEKKDPIKLKVERYVPATKKTKKQPKKNSIATESTVVKKRVVKKRVKKETSKEDVVPIPSIEIIPATPDTKIEEINIEINVLVSESKTEDNDILKKEENIIDIK